MVIVRISSGLGNQMFQYALYCALEQQGVPVKADLSLFSRAKDGRVYELESVFGLQLPRAGRMEVAALQAFSKLAWKMLGRPYKETYAGFGTFNPAILQRRHAYLNGYWQSEKYFSAVGPLVRERFRFSEPPEMQNREWIGKMRTSESVSLHVRRTDFVERYNWGIDPAYYHAAVARLKAQLGHPEFFVFSDDLAWARAQFTGPEFQFVEGNRGAGSFRDMQLMQSCRHHIIANSTFSWWGAWLNPDPGKIVIAPDCWQPELQGTRDIVPPGWIQLPTGMLNSRR